jgi:hypothetical protein
MHHQVRDVGHGHAAMIRIPSLASASHHERLAKRDVIIESISKFGLGSFVGHDLSLSCTV